MRSNNSIRARLGWTFLYIYCIFVHPNLDSVPLLVRMRERSILDWSSFFFYIYMYYSLAHHSIWKSVTGLRHRHALDHLQNKKNLHCEQNIKPSVIHTKSTFRVLTVFSWRWNLFFNFNTTAHPCGCLFSSVQWKQLHTSTCLFTVFTHKKKAN